MNSGSLERRLIEKYGSPTPEALVESALGHVKLLNDCDFDDIVISIKSSDVKLMIEAYRLLAKQVDYPLHLGVTEAGTERMGVIKSAVGIGSLLCDGIGDTIRGFPDRRPGQGNLRRKGYPACMRYRNRRADRGVSDLRKNQDRADSACGAGRKTLCRDKQADKGRGNGRVVNGPGEAGKRISV